MQIISWTKYLILKFINFSPFNAFWVQTIVSDYWVLLVKHVKQYPLDIPSLHNFPIYWLKLPICRNVGYELGSHDKGWLHDQVCRLIWSLQWLRQNKCQVHSKVKVLNTVLKSTITSINFVSKTRYGWVVDQSQVTNMGRWWIDRVADMNMLKVYVPPSSINSSVGTTGLNNAH